MKKFAFLTGINQYGILPILKYARQDAEAVAAAIQKYYQFMDSEITLMTDQQKGFLMPMTKQVIENRLKELEGTNPDLFIFGFWGHGFFEKQLYFCPMGASRENVVEEGFAMSRLIELIGNIGAKSAFLILDCCQSEATRGGIAKAMSPENETGLVNAARDIGLRLKQRAPQQQDFVPNIAILNSCKVGQSAYEWDERKHGIFTAHLLDAFGQGLDSVGKITDLLGRQVSITASRLGHNQKPFFQLQGSIKLPVVEQKDGKFFVRLPDRAKDMKILEPTIDDINITVVPVGSAEEQAIASDVIQLPPIPSELVQLRSEITGIDEAVERLQAGNHPALAQAQEAIQTAQAQVESLALKKVQTWQAFQQAGGDIAQLEEWVQQNPETSALQARDLCPKSFNAPKFVSLVIWGQQWQLACWELERVQEQYEQKRTDAIEELMNRQEQNLADQEDIIEQLKESVVLDILANLPGYDSISSPLPEQELALLLPELEKYEMNWDSWELFDLAEQLWENERPVMVQEREAEEKRQVALQMVVQEHEAEKERQVALRKAGTRKVISVNGVEFAFRWCPSGVFNMGSPADKTEMKTITTTGFFGRTYTKTVALSIPGETGRYSNETQHEVTLTKGFWMQETQVTQKQWQAVMGSNPSYHNIDDLPFYLLSGAMLNNPSCFKGDDLPVEKVSWNDCQIFCRICKDLGLPVQLPTEAQWEYACRAGTTEAYAGDLDAMAWYESNSNGTTHPVGTKNANAWGLYDMYGNVWERCRDWYNSDMTSNSVTDPKGPDSGLSRVIRGGGWGSNAQNCRSADRNGNSPEYRGYDLGFRLSLD